jgi:hypothetical protein
MLWKRFFILSLLMAGVKKDTNKSHHKRYPKKEKGFFHINQFLQLRVYGSGRPVKGSIKKQEYLLAHPSQLTIHPVNNRFGNLFRRSSPTKNLMVKKVYGVLFIYTLFCQ